MRRKGAEAMRAFSTLIGIVGILWGFWVEAKEILFPEMAGWKRSDQVQTFGAGTLYEYIDGAADLYLMYEFVELRVMDYENEQRGQVTVDVYRHKTPLNAFGIYSQERLPQAEFLPIGLEAYYQRGVLNLLTGPYYVKLSSVNTGPEDRQILIAFAKKMADLLGPKGTFPALLSAFPAEGKGRYSEKFFPKNFLGYAFFQNAYTADYTVQGQPFKLFVMDGKDENGCREMLKAYLQAIHPPRKDPSPGRLTLKDPHHGEFELSWQGRYFWGILNFKEASLRSRYLSRLEEGLKRIPKSCCD